MTRLKVMTVFCAAIFCGGSIALAHAQSTSDTDKHFVRDAIEGGNGEVELGRLAQQKSSSDDIKQFGQKMVDDHTRLGDQMRSVAEKVGVQPPAGTSMGDKALEAKLDLLSGDTFDKAYIQAMVKGHREDLTTFEKEESSGTDPEVRDAARQGAKVVRAHLQLVEEIARSHNIDVGK